MPILNAGETRVEAVPRYDYPSQNTEDTNGHLGRCSKRHGPPGLRAVSRHLGAGQAPGAGGGRRQLRFHRPAARAHPRVDADLHHVLRRGGVPVVYSTGIDREVKGAGWANRARKTELLEPLPEADYEKRKLGNTIVKEIEPQPGDVVLRKIGPSVFFGTPLTTLLNEMDVDTLIVTGTTTSGCVRATVVDAASLDFYVGVVEECTFDRFEVSHKVSLMDMHAKYGSVISTDAAMEYIKQTAEPEPISIAT